MLPRAFTEEQAMFRGACCKLPATGIVPQMEAWREAGLVGREAVGKAGEQGFLMVWPEEKYGGQWYMDEYPISRQYTDASISTIYAGSSEVVTTIISRDCLGENHSPFNARNF